MVNSIKKKVIILGSTGSIGENAVWVARQLKSELCIVGLAAGNRWERLAEQAHEFNCRQVAVANPGDLAGLRSALPAGCRATADEQGLIDMVTADDVDTVLCAITGTAGLRPVLAAIRAGKDIALASKEILVMAGQIVMPEVRRCGVRILPVDSEHSAIFQCLEGHRIEDVQRLILTASGGPFRQLDAEALQKVSHAEALAHPTWNMGPKVTIDSATLMNKALELIEARWLFDIGPERLDVVIHPQSIIHSMVEFNDGSILAQMGNPDMRIPIQYALVYPERRNTGIPRCDFRTLHQLDFQLPDHQRFPSLGLAKFALEQGHTMPTVLNAANEVAVELFSAGRLSFPGIWQTVEHTMEHHRMLGEDTLEAILAADSWSRQTAREVAAAIGH